MDFLAFWLGATAHQLTDPLSILLGIIAGSVARRWVHVLGLSIVAGIVYRLIVFAVNAEARAEPFFTLQWAGAAGAAGVIGAAIYAIRRKRRERTQLSSSSGSD